MGDDTHVAAPIADVPAGIGTWRNYMFHCQGPGVHHIDTSASLDFRKAGSRAIVRDVQLFHQHRSVLIGKPINDVGVVLQGVCAVECQLRGQYLWVGAVGVDGDHSADGQKMMQVAMVRRQAVDRANQPVIRHPLAAVQPIRFAIREIGDFCFRARRQTQRVHQGALILIRRDEQDAHAIRRQPHRADIRSGAEGRGGVERFRCLGVQEGRTGQKRDPCE